MNTATEIVETAPVTERARLVLAHQSHRAPDTSEAITETQLAAAIVMGHTAFDAVGTRLAQKLSDDIAAASLGRKLLVDYSDKEHFPNRYSSPRQPYCIVPRTPGNEPVSNAIILNRGRERTIDRKPCTRTLDYELRFDLLQRRYPLLDQMKDTYDLAYEHFLGVENRTTVDMLQLAAKTANNPVITHYSWLPGDLNNHAIALEKESLPKGSIVLSTLPFLAVTGNGEQWAHLFDPANSIETLARGVLGSLCGANTYSDYKMQPTLRYLPAGSVMVTAPPQFLGGYWVPKSLKAIPLLDDPTKPGWMFTHEFAFCIINPGAVSEGLFAPIPSEGPPETKLRADGDGEYRHSSPGLYRMAPRTR